MKIKSMLAAATAAMIMASCSSDETIDQNNNKVQKGEDTYASFALKFKSGTRADILNGTDDESSVTSMNVYVFSNGVLEATASPAVSSNQTVPVKVTTGEKIIYAVTGSMPNLTNLSGSKIEMAQNATLLADFEKALYASLPADIAVAKHFTMIGNTRSILVKQSEEEAKANPIAITLDRAAAKAQVHFNNPNILPTLNADFGSAKFAVAQIARQMYVTLDSRFTPLGTSAANGSTYPGLTPVNDLTYVDAYSTADYDGTAAVNAPCAYMAECAVAEPTTGNTTISIIQTKVTPKSTVGGALDSDGTFYVLARNDEKTATWVFASDESYNLLYFNSEAAANSYKSENDLSAEYLPYKYDKGLCYYRVHFIDENYADSSDLSKKYRVLRNYFYRVNVTDIRALGAPTAPGTVPTDPDTPIEQDNWLACTITVSPWTVNSQSTILR